MTDTITAPKNNNAYIPGVCNINHAEITRRRLVGYIGGAAFIVLLALLVFTHVNTLIRLLLFLPAFMGAIGFLQSRNRFCVNYASRGIQNANEESVQPHAVTQKTDIRKDRNRARQITGQALIIAILLTLITLLIP